MRARLPFAVVLGALGVAAACSPGTDAPDAQAMLSQDQLEDPATCQQCHASQFSEWASSMHAYAGVDPIFLAMNARGQRETNGALGSFCVQCHAPMALRLGLTTDGHDLASVPAWAKGVTCYFCHAASEASAGNNDDPIVLSTDGAMRAAIADLAPGAPHAGAYSRLHDQHDIGSSQMCGSCHDVTNQHGVSIEATFAEWRASEFAELLSANDNTRSCSACHMPSRQGQAATYPTTSPTREIHDHSMAGVDLALTPFPGQDAQRALVQQQLDAAVHARLCVKSGDVEVTLETENVGHSWPSGAVQDRRAWVELVAKSAGQVVFQSGVVADGQSITSIADPSLWLLREPMYDGNGSEVPFLWQALSVGASVGLPAAKDIQGPGALHSVTHGFTVPAATDTVTMRVRIVPFDQAQLADLVTSGDLDPQVAAGMPVLSLAGTTLTWNARGTSCVE